MSAVEEVETILTPGQPHPVADFRAKPCGEGATGTQQLLDELLGRFEDDDSTMLLAHGPTPEFYVDSDE